MKKLFLFVLTIISLTLISCGKLEEKPPVNDINLAVAEQLQKMDNNYSDETLKALSVAIRNNVIINGENGVNNNIDKKYLNIAKSTNGKTLKNVNNDIIEISFQSNDNYTWQKNIKKNQILEFALQNDINLANLTNIEHISEKGRVIGLKIGNQTFDYNKLADYFNLESNKIESISSSKNEIIINGKGNDFYNHFDISQAEQLSNNNHNYLEILEEIFTDFKVI